MFVSSRTTCGPLFRVTVDLKYRGSSIHGECVEGRDLLALPLDVASEAQPLNRVEESPPHDGPTVLERSLRSKIQTRVGQERVATAGGEDLHSK